VQYRLLHDDDQGQRTFAVILEVGDEVMSCLQNFAEKERITAAQLTAIGAFQEAQLAFFDWETRAYQAIPVGEQVEVASMIGDIAMAEGKPSLHVHAVLGRRDGTALAGHLQEGHVRPTLEVIVTESPTHLCKVKDKESGLALINPRICT
jgi:uncharacterized protein